jgi:hypothetical protein
MVQLMMAGAGAGGCEINQPFDAKQYIEGFARKDLGASPSDLRLDESRMPAMLANDQQANGLARQYGTNTEQASTVAFGKLAFRDGTQGLAHAAVTNLVTRKPDMMTGGTTVITTTAVFHFVVIRYPPAAAAEASRLLNMIMASSRTNPIWKQATDQFITQLGNREHADRMEKIRLQGEQARAYARAQSDAGDARMRDWELRQASSDKQHKAFVQAIREVETWRDASGSVELAAGYDQAWSRGDGSYILSNKPGFDPNAAFKEQRWSQMKRAD